MGVVTSILFGLFAAAFISLFIGPSLPPWIYIDKTLKHTVAIAAGKGGFDIVVDDARWHQSFDDRVSDTKYLCLGFILIALIPLNKFTSSQWLVDWAWASVEKLKSVSNEFGGAFGTEVQSPDWRSVPYELWEMCVLGWTVSFFGSSVSREYVRYHKLRKSSIEIVVRNSMKIFICVQVIAVLGVIFLILANNPFYRLLFELVLVGFFLVSDITFSILYARGGWQREAKGLLRSCLFLEVPGFVAFATLLVFLVSCNLGQFESHWAAAFVAGAGAFNLMFLSTALIIMRTVQSYDATRVTTVNTGIEKGAGNVPVV